MLSSATALPLIYINKLNDSNYTATISDGPWQQGRI